MSTSSIILHSLQNNGSDKDTFDNMSGNYNSSNTNSTSSVKNILFEDFSVAEESGIWIGRKISSKKKLMPILFWLLGHLLCPFCRFSK